jgi:hypothetical protein
VLLLAVYPVRLDIAAFPLHLKYVPRVISLLEDRSFLAVRALLATIVRGRVLAFPFLARRVGTL